jgi:hypothetical protein
LHEGGVEHGDGGLLEGHVGAAVEVGAAGADAVWLLERDIYIYKGSERERGGGVRGREKEIEIEKLTP